MKVTFLLLAVALLCLQWGVAYAQTEEKIVHPEVTILNIDEPLQVPGELVRPSNSYVPVKKGAEFDPLIPVRDNFLPEIMKTAGGI